MKDLNSISITAILNSSPVDAYNAMKSKGITDPEEAVRTMEALQKLKKEPGLLKQVIEEEAVL